METLSQLASGIAATLLALVLLSPLARRVVDRKLREVAAPAPSAAGEAGGARRPPARSLRGDPDAREP